MKKWLLLPFLVLVLNACSQQSNVSETDLKHQTSSDSTVLSEVDEHYQQYADAHLPSVSKGSVENGSLENGRIFPFSGTNYHYFDTTSYLANRGFVHEKVRDCVLAAYKQLEKSAPGREFGIMECSNEHGGKIAPHRTHQCGLSVDFMSPLRKNDQPYTDLDYLGGRHYLMNFDSDGRYEDDKSINIDFELMAQHLVTLIEEAKNNGLKVKKIIWKMELQDELFATPSGKKLQQSGVYVTKNLSPLINSVHDDHYHVDFEIVK